MQIGTLERIWRYPVKSLRGIALGHVAVETDGLCGDRTSALFVTGGHARTGKTLRGKEHDRLHLHADAGLATADAAGRGIATQARDGDAHYFDDAPVSLIVDRWLDGLNAHVGYPVEPSRFRPNFFVRASAGLDGDEKTLTGATIAVGAARLKVRYGIKRCVAITYHPDGELADPRILRYVATERANLMGVYCDVLRAGRARVGDSVFVEA